MRKVHTEGAKVRLLHREKGARPRVIEHSGKKYPGGKRLRRMPNVLVVGSEEWEAARLQEPMEADLRAVRRKREAELIGKIDLRARLAEVREKLPQDATETEVLHRLNEVLADEYHLLARQAKMDVETNKPGVEHGKIKEIALRAIATEAGMELGLGEKDYALYGELRYLLGNRPRIAKKAVKIAKEGGFSALSVANVLENRRPAVAKQIFLMARKTGRDPWEVAGEFGKIRPGFRKRKS